MDELHDQGRNGDDSHDSAADVISEADHSLRPVDQNGQENWAEDAEPLTRGEYADQMRQGPEIEENDNSAYRDADDYGANELSVAEDNQEAEDLPEPRTRQEVADEADRADPAVPDHDQAADADLDAGIAEEDNLPEPRTRQEVAEDARSGTDPLMDDASTLWERPADNAAESPSADRRQHERQSQNQDDDIAARVTVLQARPADRTLGDTTPTGVGLKPTGDQLFHMESDDPAESRLDKFLKRATEEAGDLHDGVGNTIETVLDFRSPASGGTSHAYEGHVGHEHPPQPDSQGVSDMIGGAALVAVAMVASARHWIRNRSEVKELTDESRNR